MTEIQAEFTLRRINELIMQELDRACMKHQKFPIDIIHQVAVVNEEAGEAMRAALQLSYENADVNELKKELIQTASSCIRVLFKIAEGEYRAINSHPRNVTRELVTT